MTAETEEEVEAQRTASTVESLAISREIVGLRESQDQDQGGKILLQIFKFE